MPHAPRLCNSLHMYAGMCLYSTYGNAEYGGVNPDFESFRVKAYREGKNPLNVYIRSTYVYIELFLFLFNQLITLLPQYSTSKRIYIQNLNEIQFAAPQNPTRRDRRDPQTTFSVAGDNTIL